MLQKDQIVSKLPYSTPFLFVDEILEISENTITGTYTFPPDSYFYKGHFVDHPVTPGVLLTECMAQIGLVSLGIYLLCKDNSTLYDEASVAMSENRVLFNKPVYPGEKVTVTAEKLYFRMQKLKCKVLMKNTANEEVCRGELSGMIISKK